MHGLTPLITDLAIILGVAGVVTLVFQKLRQPVVLGYLLSGMIIGPYTPFPPWVSDVSNIRELSELGVIFLLFSLGLEFNFEKLTRVGFSATVTGIIEVFLMLALGIFTGLLLDMSWTESIFLGAALSISSTTIIIKALEDFHLKNNRFSHLVFGILVIEDLLAILLLVSLALLPSSQGVFSWSMLLEFTKLILVVGGWFLIGYFLMPTLFRKFLHEVSDETLTIISTALCLGLAWMATYFQYSTALGAFIMGSILAETKWVHRIEHLIRPLRSVFAAVFFVSIGMLINFQVLVHQWQWILLLSAITIAGKIGTTTLGALLTGQSVRSSVQVGFSMAQIGEFSFIIAGLGATLNLISPNFYPIIVGISGITTFTTPYLIRSAESASRLVEASLPRRLKRLIGHYDLWISHLAHPTGKSLPYGKMVLRLVINAIAIAIIFILMGNLFLPAMDNRLTLMWIDNFVSWTLALLLGAPFIWGMLFAFRFKDPENIRAAYAPLTLISIALTIWELLTLSTIYFFKAWMSTAILVALSIAFLILIYRKLEVFYQWFEKHLKMNLNTASVHNVDHMVPWGTQLVEVEVGSTAEMAGKTLKELQVRKQYKVNVVATYRGERAIFAPQGDQVMFPGDKLLLLGTSEAVASLKKVLESSPILPETDNLPEHFMLKTIDIQTGSDWVGQTIRSSRLDKKFNGMVVGLERAERRILNPDSETVLMVGDKLLILGERHRLSMLGGDT